MILDRSERPVSPFAMRIVRASYVYRAMGWPVEQLAAFWTRLGHADDSSWHDPDGSLSSLEQMVMGSRLLRPVLAIVDRFARAARSARSVTLGKQLVAAARTLPPDVIVRLTGFALVAAVVTHAVFLAFTPARLRPGLPWTFAALLLVFAVVMIVANGPVARAWARWRDR
jgi:hypothetical protein